MPYSIEYDSDHDCMMCSITGVLDEQLALTFVKRVSEALIQHDCNRVLNDVREVNLALSTINIYEMPKHVINAGYGFNTRRALLVKDIGGDHQFFETVSANWSQQVRIFTEIDEALAWLKEDGD